MTKQPPYLKKGDKIAIVCPASRLPKSIDKAISVLESWGLEVISGKTVTAEQHQFAGDDTIRLQDLQWALNDPSIKAIIAGRGGYGTIRIIDQLDFSSFVQQPKWIVGFSDITVLLSHINTQFGIPSIHAQMPYTFEEATPASLESLRCALFGISIDYGYTFNPPLPEAIWIGGNLTLLVMLEGSPSAPAYTDKILFIEDVGERPAAIDRMMRMLDRAGKLSKLKGLVIGAFNELPEEKIPFGETTEEIIKAIAGKYGYPIWTGFPVGHIEDNRAVVIGKVQ